MKKNLIIKLICYLAKRWNVIKIKINNKEDNRFNKEIIEIENKEENYKKKNKKHRWNISKTNF